MARSPLYDVGGEGWCEEGGVAQLGEHSLCKRKVTGSSPVASTIVVLVLLPCGVTGRYVL